jgi:NlpC/P60 family putative phage cell wall peptidase
MKNGETYREIRPVDCAVLAEAQSWIGTPYRHQASAKGIGADCLGLLRGIWRNIHGDEPEHPGAYAPDWAEAGETDRLLDAARRRLIEICDGELHPGCVLVFRWRHGMPAKHVGIYAGDGRFIHAYSGHGVLSSALVPQWRRRIAGVYVFPDIPGER